MLSGRCAVQLLELLRGKQVTATVADYAASAHALLFALAPGHRRIHPAGEVMLHHPAAIVLGTARDLQVTARKLRQQSERWIARLARRTGRPPAEWRGYLESEAVFSAGQAVHLGLADEVFG